MVTAIKIRIKLLIMKLQFMQFIQTLSYLLFLRFKYLTLNFDLRYYQSVFFLRIKSKSHTQWRVFRGNPKYNSVHSAWFLILAETSASFVFTRSLKCYVNPPALK